MAEPNGTSTPTAPNNLATLMQQNPFTFFLMLMVLGGQGYDIMGGQTSKVEIQQLTAQVTTLISEVRDMSNHVDRHERRIEDHDDEIRDLAERLRRVENTLEDASP
jgi:hypothetical protein